MADKRFKILYADHSRTHRSLIVLGSSEKDAINRLKSMHRDVEHVISVQAINEELLNEEEDNNMDYNETRDRIIDVVNNLNLSEDAQQELIDIFENAVDMRAAMVLAETIQEIQNTAEAAVEAVNESHEQIIDALDAYLNDQVNEEFGTFQERQYLLAAENEELLNLLSVTLEILGVDPEEVYKRASALARGHAIDRGSSGEEWGDGVKGGSAEQNRSSVAGSNSARGVNGLGDQGGVVRNESECDPRVKIYNDFLNKRPGGGLFHGPGYRLSTAMSPQPLTEEQEIKLEEKQAVEQERMERLNDAVNEIFERQARGLIMR